jgi:hypothetical protein
VDRHRGVGIGGVHQRETETKRCVDALQGERTPNLGHGTTNAIDGYRYGLPVGDDFFDAQCSTGRIWSMSCGIGRWLEALSHLNDTCL